MVHRKSTYTLNFKTITNELRKSIWEENTFIREKRRSTEMSHHSIDEDEDECECDNGEKIKENKTTSEERPSSLRHNQKDLHTEENSSSSDHKRKTSSAERPLKEEEGREGGHNGGKLSAKDKEIGKVCCGCHSSSRQIKDRVKPPQNDDVIVAKERLHCSACQRSQATSEESRYKASLREGPYKERQDLPSETNEMARDGGRTEKGNKGVMKLSPWTGELDLIPSRLAKVQRTPVCDFGCSRRQCCGVRNSSRNVINIRPRTSVVSHFGRTPRRPRECYDLSWGEVGPSSFRDCSGDSRRALSSTRKEPRLSVADKAVKKLTRSSECVCCGEQVKMRSVMT